MELKRNCPGPPTPRPEEENHTETQNKKVDTETDIAQHKYSIQYLLRWGGSATAMGGNNLDNRIIKVKQLGPRYSGDQKSPTGATTVFNLHNSSSNQLTKTNRPRNNNRGIRSIEAIEKRKQTRTIKRYIALQEI